MNSKMFKKKSGQALLVVLVISTLTLLILMGVANRLLQNQTSVRKSEQFDTAVAASENALNEIIKVVGNDTCAPNFNQTEYVKFNCPPVDNLGVEVFARVPKDIYVHTDVNSPISLVLTGSQYGTNGTNSMGVKITCKNPSNIALDPVNPQNIKFVVTRVYTDASGDYQITKGVSNCQAANANSSSYVNGDWNNNGDDGNINFYSSTQGFSGNTQFSNVKLIRVRLLDGSPDVMMSVENKNIDPNTGAPHTDGSTGRFEFIVVGLGDKGKANNGLGSDNIVKFEKPRGDYNYVPSGFDFVYFGED